MIIDQDKEVLASELRGSLLKFCQYFYPLLFSRDFIIPNPLGREPHVVTICRALTRAARLELPSQRLWISVPPGHGKSTMLIMWTAWTLAQYPDSKYLYISYSVSLAAKHTETIKRVIQLPHYKYLFDVEIRHDARGKEFFQTKQGGAIAAFGSTGSIVGTDAGLPGLDRFSGGLILDDLHKIDEAHSDTIRNSVITNYRETIQQRCRGVNVPFIGIGQRVHEEDVAAYLLNGNDGYNWEHVVLKSIDDAGNALYPEAFPLSMLKLKEQFDPYVFSSQFQQNPIPAGGALFKEDEFVLLNEEPDILMTFITADTAETDKSYNDATVFSFWGVYDIEMNGQKTGQTGLHWLDCLELRIEPRDLHGEFMGFYGMCMTHRVKPLVAAIEKKSTGVTLISTLKDARGLEIRDINRTKASGSKTSRYLEMQPVIAAKLISLPADGRHTRLCLDHMVKITANNAHRFDDICDTLYDACKIALIDKSLQYKNAKQNDGIAARIMSKQKAINRVRELSHGSH